MIAGVLSWAIPQEIGLTTNAPVLETGKTVGTYVSVIVSVSGI